MTRRSFNALFTGLLFPLLASHAPAAENAAGKPNVLFIAVDDLNDWAIDQLLREHDKPFFIALGLKKPHLPWVAPRKYFEMFDPETIQLPDVPEDDLDDLPDAGKLFANSLLGFFSPDDHKLATREPGAWQELVHVYLATCAFADANVGRLLDALKTSPHADNTIVVLWGDHGWHLGEKQHWRTIPVNSPTSPS